jgi:hypothetical protein
MAARVGVRFMTQDASGARRDRTTFSVTVEKGGDSVFAHLPGDNVFLGLAAYKRRRVAPVAGQKARFYV